MSAHPDTIVWVAAANDMKAVVGLLSEGSNPNSRNDKNRTALHNCSSGEIAEVLIKHGAEVDCEDSHNSTPLTLAAEKGHVSKVEVLLKHGAAVNHCDKDGDTAAHAAAVGKQLEVMKLLVKKNPDLSIKNGKGRTALQKAEENGQKDMVTLIKKHSK